MLRVTHRAGVQEPLWFLHIRRRNICRAAKCDVVANKITAPNIDNWLPRLILQAFPRPVCRSITVKSHDAENDCETENIS